MANNADQHLKMLIGDFAVQLAIVRAHNEQLQETVATLQGQLAPAPSATPAEKVDAP